MLNSLHSTLFYCCAEAALLYGRGMRAGIDRREQKKAAATYQGSMMTKLRTAAGIEETSDMRTLQKNREALADRYDGFDMRVSASSALECKLTTRFIKCAVYSVFQELWLENLCEGCVVP